MTRIFLVCLLFCVTGLGVFSVQTVELNGIVGQSVILPDAVKNMGSLSFGVNKDKQATVGDVTGGKFTPVRDRVQWDSSTGRFSITDLNKEDSGMYTVVNNDAAGKAYQYQLNVYINVSVPLVNTDTHPCTMQCSVERGTAVTLSWYREGETESYASSDSLDAPYLKLPMYVEKGGVYTCEAKNSVSRETAKLTVGDHCAATPGPNTGLIVAIVVTVVAVIIIALLTWKIIQMRKEMVERSKSQGEKGDNLLPQPPATPTAASS